MRSIFGAVHITVYCLYKLGRSRESIDAYERAFSIDTNFAALLYISLSLSSLAFTSGDGILGEGFPKLLTPQESYGGEMNLDACMPRWPILPSSKVVSRSDRSLLHEFFAFGSAR